MAACWPQDGETRCPSCPLLIRGVKARQRTAHAVLSALSYCLLQPPAALQGWGSEQQSCRHNPAFTTPATLGESCRPHPAGRDCGAAIPQLGSQGRSLASGSLQSPLHNCARPVRLSHPQHCSPSPPASPLLMSSVQMLSWFPKETRVVQPWVPSWSSPPCPGISAGMFHFWAPEASRSGHRMRGPLALIR